MASSIKDVLNARREYIKHYNIDPRELAYYNFRARRLSENINGYCVEQIKLSSTSDSIYLTVKEDEFLINLWEPRERKNFIEIPSDLFFAKTIPLLDCVINIDEREIQNGRIVKYRVVIFDEYKEKVDFALKNTISSPFIVGAVILLDETFDDKPAIFIPIVVVCGVGALAGGEYFGYFNKQVADSARYKIEYTSRAFVSMMETWYGIQIALLHPEIKEVFRNPQRSAYNNTRYDRTQKCKKRKVKYIRNHYLTIDKLENASGSKEARKINRRCLAWYVIGHWRTYKDGKKVFVMPYWKGALRDLKQNMDGDEREREIDFDRNHIEEEV